MKVIITGGCGFIGSHLVKELINEGGHLIHIIDDLSTGNKDNLFGYMHKIGVAIFEPIQSISATTLMYDNADIMVHLGSSVGVRTIVEHPLESMENSLNGTKAALELAARMGCRKFIFASTSEVYGSGLNSRFSEDDDFRVGQSCYPRWSYAACKIVDEFMVQKFCKNHGIDPIILRFFNIVGTNQTSQYGMVMPRFIEAAIANKPLRVYDNGENVRTFTSVYDCVKVIRKFFDIDTHERVYNIGSNNVTTIRDLANTVIRLHNSDSTIEFVSSKDIYGEDFQDTPVRIPDITRLSRIVDTNKFLNLTQIITSMWPTCSERLVLTK